MVKAVTMSKYFERKRHWFVVGIIIGILLGIMLCSAVNVFAMSGLIKKPLVEVKAQLAEQVEINNKLRAELSVVKAQNMKLEAQIKVPIAAPIGANNTVEQLLQEIRVGRDYKVHNDKEIYVEREKSYQLQLKNQNDELLKLYGIFAILILALVWIVKNMFREMSNARYYQLSIAKMSQNGELEQVMKQKREIEDKKKLTYRAVNLYKSVMGRKEAL